MNWLGLVLFIAALAAKRRVPRKDTIDQINAKRININSKIKPTVFAESETSMIVHQFLYSMLWMGPRFYRGDEKHFMQIPQLSLTYAERYFNIVRTDLNVDFPDAGTKKVNITILILESTPVIRQLIDEAGLQTNSSKMVLNSFPNPGKAIQKAESANTRQKGRPDPAQPRDVLYDFKYFFEAVYDCRDPAQATPSATQCQYWQYYLRYINVTITEELTPYSAKQQPLADSIMQL